MNPKGIIVRPSPYPVEETIDRLQTFLQNAGTTIYARINQQLEAKNAGLDLLPLEFLLFGNPTGGGAFMAANPLVALDLPLKVIAWQDNKQKTWLAYNEAAYIEERYSLEHNGNSPLALGKMINAALKT